jgi:hypothetical protein
MRKKSRTLESYVKKEHSCDKTLKIYICFPVLDRFYIYFPVLDCFHICFPLLDRFYCVCFPVLDFLVLDRFCITRELQQRSAS